MATENTPETETVTDLADLGTLAGAAPAAADADAPVAPPKSTPTISSSAGETARASPPCPSATPRTIASPTPVPP